MTNLYPPIAPFATDMIAVSNLHTISYAQYGTKGAKPVLFVHGGPGGGTQPIYAQFFNPEHYWIILVDQRGCGKSTPHAELEDNHTDALIEDFEKIRKQLGIDKWQLFGGSWGSTLSLAYAQKHPDVVTEMILRGIFLARQEEIDWLFQSNGGARIIYPDAWEAYEALVPESERHNMIGYYYQMLSGGDQALRLKAAKAFACWEFSISKLRQDPRLLKQVEDPSIALPFACLEAHYLSQQAFLKPNQLLNNIHAIQHIPGVLVQGRYDVVCPVKSAWDLHKAWQGSQLVIVPDAGHSMLEPGIVSALVNATDSFIR